MKHWCFILLFVLAGCSQIPSGQSFIDRPPADTINHFAFNGRLAVRQGETRHHVRIDWRHSPARDEVFLTTPLGQGLAEIVRDAAGARLTLADQQIFFSPDPDRLAERVFGFSLPLGSAPDWLLGRATVIAPWRLTVVARESTAPHALPIIVDLEHEGIEVRLKIDEWSETK